MPEIAEFEIIGKTDQAVKNVGKLNDEIKKTKKTTTKAKDELSGLQQIGGEAVKQLDRMTGGLASKLVAVGKAAKLSGKAMKTALISSGIGLAVVAIGLIVEYWDEIGETLGFINKDLERQLELNEENKGVIDSELSLLEKQIDFNKKRGISNAANIKQQKKLLEAKKVILDSDIRILEAQILKEKIAARELSWYGKIKVAALENLGFYEKAAEIKAKALANNDIDLEDQQKINALIGDLNKLKIEGLNLDEKLDPVDESKDKVEVDPEVEIKAKAIEEITRLEDEYFESLLEKRTQEENAVYDKYFAQIEAAKQYGLSTTELEAARQSELALINKTYTEKAEQDEIDRLASIKKIQDDHKEFTDIEKLEQQQTEALAELTLLKATKDEKLAIEKFYEDAILDVKKKNKEEEKALSDELLKQGLNDAQATFDMVGQLAGKDSKVGKAMAIASATISGIQGTMNAFATANKSPITVAFPAYPFIQAGLAGAVALKNIAAIKSIDPSGKGNTGSVPTSSGGGGAAIPPAFNVVGQSDTNQLADAIGGQSQRPSRSYVVSNDVTTSQELERNIIEGASIG